MMIGEVSLRRLEAKQRKPTSPNTKPLQPAITIWVLSLINEIEFILVVIIISSYRLAFKPTLKWILDLFLDLSKSGVLLVGQLAIVSGFREYGGEVLTTCDCFGVDSIFAGEVYLSSAVRANRSVILFLFTISNIHHLPIFYQIHQ